jgi:hypothetical protein
MENTKPSSTNLAIKWSVLYLIASAVITFAVQLMNMDINSPVKYLSYLIFIAFLLLTQKEYRDKLGGFITFGDAFTSGFVYSIFSGILSAIFVYVYLAFINPGALTQAAEAARAQLEAKGQLSSDQIDTAVNITVKYGAIFGSVGGLIGSIVLGAIVALIGAAIFKKERSIFDIEAESNTAAAE